LTSEAIAFFFWRRSGCNDSASSGICVAHYAADL
jgi:hypothetical protein